MRLLFGDFLRVDPGFARVKYGDFALVDRCELRVRPFHGAFNARGLERDCFEKHRFHFLVHRRFPS